MPELTRDADKMICIIYKMYLEKIKSGMSKTQAKSFEENFYTSDKTLSSWHTDDIDTTIRELRKKEFLNVYITGDFVLSDNAIVYMENRFKNGFIELTDFISKFI